MRNDRCEQRNLHTMVGGLSNSFIKKKLLMQLLDFCSVHLVILKIQCVNFSVTVLQVLFLSFFYDNYGAELYALPLVFF